MLGYFLISCLLLYAEGRPNDLRYRRDEDVNGVVYAPCKDTYPQCGEWKKSGMCEMPQYKDYMPLVCTDTCGFCKAKLPEPVAVAAVGAAASVPEPAKVEAPPAPAPAQKDKIQEDYEEQLRKYYVNLQKQQTEYQAAVSPQPSATESGTSNSGVPALPSDNLTPSVSAEGTTAPGTFMSYLPYGGQYGAQYSGGQYGAQPSPYGAPASPYPYSQPAGGSSSSTSVGTQSSSSSSSSTNTSSGSSVGLAPTNGTEGNATATEASVLPSKVAPETPSLPALPPLLALPPISESLLVDDSKSNSTTSVEKETENKEKDKQEADSKPYAAEPANSTSSKKEGKKQKQKELVKAESDRKITTEDQQTNEMTKSESKHLTASAREAVKTDDDNNDDDGEDEDEEKGGDQKVIKAFSSDPGKIKLSNKKKSMDSDIKVTKHQRAQQKSEKEKSSENEDAVFKHDEKSVSDGGSGAAGMEESVEDLNYITDFNPDDFDMDVADISRKDLIRLHDKRDLVRYPKNHPLFSGIQKARSVITAPTIIDATEDGVGDSPLVGETHKKEHEKHTKPAKKEKVSKIEESSGAPTEVQSKFFESNGGDEDEDDDEEDADKEVNANEDADKKNKIKVETKTKEKSKKEVADKKNKVKQNADKKDATPKSKIKKNKETDDKVNETSKRKNKISKHEESVRRAEKKSKPEDPKPTIGMKSKININFKKSETKVHEKSKLVSTKDKIEAKKDRTTGKKENKQEKSELNDEFTDGDTAAVRHKKITSVATTKRKEISKAEASSSKGTLKKRTNDDDKDTDTTIADLSGAGSGETDTDMLSGDSPTRSLDESGDNDADEEEDDDNDEEDSSHSRQNLQLHGDPEMVDLKPKETAEQPDLNDFPDVKDQSFSTKDEEKEEKETDQTSDKKNVSDDETELDDIKIEELLNPKAEEKQSEEKPEEKKKKKRKEKALKEGLKEGKISMVLQQNFNVLYENKDSPSYQMLSGNIKKDIQKMVGGTAVNDITFSEVSVEGNPRQSGKTKANFNIKAQSNEWMKDLLKMVDSGDIDGLRVIKGSLEIEEEKK